MLNAQFDSDNVVKICKRKLKISFRCNKEYNGWYMIGKRRVARITIPKGKKNISPGLYKGMAEDLLLSTSEFDNLMSCPLSGDGYKKIVQKRL